MNAVFINLNVFFFLLLVCFLVFFINYYLRTQDAYRECSTCVLQWFITKKLDPIILEEIFHSYYKNLNQCCKIVRITDNVNAVHMYGCDSHRISVQTCLNQIQ